MALDEMMACSVCLSFCLSRETIGRNCIRYLYPQLNGTAQRVSAKRSAKITAIKISPTCFWDVLYLWLCSAPQKLWQSRLEDGPSAIGREVGLKIIVRSSRRERDRDALKQMPHVKVGSACSVIKRFAPFLFYFSSVLPPPPGDL